MAKFYPEDVDAVFIPTENFAAMYRELTKLRIRVQELLESNNKFEQRARDAERLNEKLKEELADLGRILND